MKLNRRHILWLLIMLVALSLSCGGTPVVPPSVPTAVPGAIETFIASTQTAYGFQTASALPTITLTPTITNTPSRTPTQTPSPTNTIIFGRSPTPPKLYGFGSDSQFKCMVLTVAPEIVKVSQNFDAQWGVKNTGAGIWSDTSVDYAYVSGTPMHTKSDYDLPTTVAPGGSVTVTVNMNAPAKIGYYTTVWTLKRGRQNFCQLSLTVYVGE